jgi:menaquinone-dependent protoporphyrinogen IX oxidase
MKILVLFQSRSGHTREAADAIAQVANDLHHQVTVKSVI